MIVDFHTHLFPPEVIEDRGRFVTADATFGELYGSAKAKLATVEELLRSMDAAGIDASVALGFAWRDLDACRRHNDYLLGAAARGGGRIIPFCTLPLAAGFEAVEAEARRCVAGGARGFGELRPDNLGFELDGEQGRRLGALARVLGVVLLFHVSEPVGHAYTGKQGLGLASFYAFVREHPELKTVGAHWGGGLPFYGLMPEVRVALQHASFDTAGASLLYAPWVYRLVSELIGPEHIVFGSDFPLLSQRRSLERIVASELEPSARALIVGENARRLLDLG